MGTTPVPTSVSLTSAVHVVIEPKLIDAGTHVIVVVVMRRARALTVKGSHALVAMLLLASPLYETFQLKLPAVLNTCGAEFGIRPLVTVTSEIKVDPGSLQLPFVKRL
jgi:hypothetical protein